MVKKEERTEKGKFFHLVFLKKAALSSIVMFSAQTKNESFSLRSYQKTKDFFSLAETDSEQITCAMVGQMQGNNSNGFDNTIGRVTQVQQIMIR